MWLQVLVLFLCIYFWFLYQFSYWKKRGFPFVPGKFPMGSISGLGTTEHASDFFKREYEKYKNDGPAFGIYMMAKPTLIPTDPELIRDIFTRNFETFHERGLNVSEAADPLSQHLFFKSGQEWKELRAKLTPTFTSGKMKMMFPNVITKADRMIEYLKPFAEKAEPLEMKEIYSSFTTEVISDVAFGLETDCLGNPDSEFRRMANVAVQPSGWEFLKIFFVVSFSKLASFLRLGFNGKAVTEFFTRIVRETVSYRETNNVQRNDFMQLLMNIQKTEGLTFTDLAANSFVFFLAGFETSSSVMTFSTYELALNQDVQEKLRDEINEVLAKHNGELTYDAILEMKYLDMVFHESLRRYPIVDSQLRRSTKDFVIPNTKLVIPEGTDIMVPVNALHNDERFWENPGKFDPERFTVENAKKIVSYSYIPFSEGPRQCIGMRFGHMQTKVGLVKLLTNFKILPCSKTIVPMKFVPNGSFQSPEGGMWLKLEKL